MMIRAMVLMVLLGGSMPLLALDDLSVETRTLQQQLSLRVAPRARMWAQMEAQRVYEDAKWDERTVRMDAMGQIGAQGLMGQDIDALVFMSLVEIVRRYDTEIRSQQARVGQSLAAQPVKKWNSDPLVKPVEKPTEKLSEKTAVTQTNVIATVNAEKLKELEARRAKVVSRVNELSRQLIPFQQQLLQNYR